MCLRQDLLITLNTISSFHSIGLKSSSAQQKDWYYCCPSQCHPACCIGVTAAEFQGCFYLPHVTAISSFCRTHKHLCHLCKKLLTFVCRCIILLPSLESQSAKNLTVLHFSCILLLQVSVMCPRRPDGEQLI